MDNYRPTHLGRRNSFGDVHERQEPAKPIVADCKHVTTTFGVTPLVAPQPLTDPWQHCLNRLSGDIPQQQFNTWIRPLQAEWQDSGLLLAAPNRFIRDFVSDKYLPMINAYLLDVVAPASAQASVTVQGVQTPAPVIRPISPARAGESHPTPGPMSATPRPAPPGLLSPSNLVEGYTFERFVEGKSNQLALGCGTAGLGTSRPLL